jgi:hypothetical protein
MSVSNFPLKEKSSSNRKMPDRRSSRLPDRHFKERPQARNLSECSVSIFFHSSFVHTFSTHTRLSSTSKWGERARVISMRRTQKAPESIPCTHPQHDVSTKTGLAVLVLTTFTLAPKLSVPQLQLSYCQRRTLLYRNVSR